MDLSTTDLAIAGRGFKIEGAASSSLGFVNAAGDLNADDYNDIIVGGHTAGMTYVIFGMNFTGTILDRPLALKLRAACTACLCGVCESLMFVDCLLVFVGRYFANA